MDAILFLMFVSVIGFFVLVKGVKAAWAIALWAKMKSWVVSKSAE